MWGLGGHELSLREKSAGARAPTAPRTRGFADDLTKSSDRCVGIAAASVINDDCNFCRRGEPTAAAHRRSQGLFPGRWVRVWCPASVAAAPQPGPAGPPRPRQPRETQETRRLQPRDAGDSPHGQAHDRLIPGDGIGPEVTAATQRVLEAAGLPSSGSSCPPARPRSSRGTTTSCRSGRSRRSRRTRSRSRAR